MLVVGDKLVEVVAMVNKEVHLANNNPTLHYNNKQLREVNPRVNNSSSNNNNLAKHSSSRASSKHK